MGAFNIQAVVQTKGDKMGARGLEPQAESSQPLSDVNLENRDRFRDVILPEVEPFNN